MSLATPETEADIWERVIHPHGPLSQAAARRILELDFTSEDRTCMSNLAERNRRGELTEDEEADLDHYCRVGTLLSILKLRAKKALDNGKP